MNAQQRTVADLIEEVKAGNEDAFREIQPLLEPIVGSVVRRFSRNSESSGLAVDDLFQEAWIAIWRAVSRYDTAQYPELNYAFFRQAVIAHINGIKGTGSTLAMPRAVERFLRDVRAGLVLWKLDDAEIHDRYYPLVHVSVIARVRHGGPDSFTTIPWDDFGSEVHRRNVSRLNTEPLAVGRIEAARLMEELLDSLSPIEREVLEYRIRDDMARPLVAKKLKRSVTTVWRIERRIIGHLQRVLKDDRGLLAVVGAGDLLALQLAGAGIGGWERELRFAPHRRWRFDYAWPQQLVALEIEGGTWVTGRHNRPLGFARDLDKYNAAALLGWRLLRVTPAQVEDGSALGLVEDAVAAFRIGG